MIISRNFVVVYTVSFDRWIACLIDDRRMGPVPIRSGSELSSSEGGLSTNGN